MSELAFRGAFDFSTFDPADGRNWTKLAMFIDAEARRRDESFYTTKLLQHSTLLAAAKLSKESLDSQAEAVSDYAGELVKLQYPWLELSHEKRMSEADALVKAYQEQFGRPGEERHDNLVHTLNQQISKLRRNG